MNRSDGFDHIVSDWLHADAEHRVPDHLDAVLRRTRTERQRPAWSSLERWLPVQPTLRLTRGPQGGLGDGPRHRARPGPDGCVLFVGSGRQAATPAVRSGRDGTILYGRRTATSTRSMRRHGGARPW